MGGNKHKLFVCLDNDDASGVQTYEREERSLMKNQTTVLDTNRRQYKEHKNNIEIQILIDLQLYIYIIHYIRACVFVCILLLMLLVLWSLDVVSLFLRS